MCFVELFFPENIKKKVLLLQYDKWTYGKQFVSQRKIEFLTLFFTYEYTCRMPLERENQNSYLDNHNNWKRNKNCLLKE